jgi:hypothetical protein
MSGDDLNFRCPYQANVMKMLEAASSSTGSHLMAKGESVMVRDSGSGMLPENHC